MVWAVVNVHLYPFIVVEHQLDCGESQKQNRTKNQSRSMSCFQWIVKNNFAHIPHFLDTIKSLFGGQSGYLIYFKGVLFGCINVWLHIDSSLPTLKCIIVIFAQGFQKISTEKQLIFKKDDGRDVNTVIEERCVCHYIFSKYGYHLLRILNLDFSYFYYLMGIYH